MVLRVGQEDARVVDGVCTAAIGVDVIFTRVAYAVNRVCDIRHALLIGALVGEVHGIHGVVHTEVGTHISEQESLHARFVPGIAIGFNVRRSLGNLSQIFVIIVDPLARVDVCPGGGQQHAEIGLIHKRVLVLESADIDEIEDVLAHIGNALGCTACPNVEGVENVVQRQQIGLRIGVDLNAEDEIAFGRDERGNQRGCAGAAAVAVFIVGAREICVVGQVVALHAFALFGVIQSAEQFFGCKVVLQIVRVGEDNAGNAPVIIEGIQVGRCCQARAAHLVVNRPVALVNVCPCVGDLDMHNVARTRNGHIGVFIDSCVQFRAAGVFIHLFGNRETGLQRTPVELPFKHLIRIRAVDLHSHDIGSAVARQDVTVVCHGAAAAHDQPLYLQYVVARQNAHNVRR